MDNLSVTYHCPDFVIGVSCDESMIFSMAYLPTTTPKVKAKNLLAAECYAQIDDYFAKKRTTFDLPLAHSKTAFAKRVQQELLKIPYGQVQTYGEIAQKLKTAPRAIGGVCRANPHPLLVPCHRVVALNGLGGFMGSDKAHVLEVKKYLLQHEDAKW